MTRVFWVIAAGWIIGVIASAPSAFERADRNGAGLVVPGLSPTLSEVIITTSIALLPPLLAATVIRTRRRQGRR
jgi:hypothetical protein